MHKFHIVGFCRHSYSGTHVSVEDSDVAWIDGEVLEVNGEEIEVLCTSGKIVVVKPLQDTIFQVVAASLHLGNIEFVKREEFDSSMAKDEKSRFHLQTAAELFMCDAKALEDSLCKRVTVTRVETITK
ncbi:hypothetical protein P8452_28082 [Trifolium repens]|nr:hypothetical protein P8452_28082 [Trifolium repens]